MRNRSSMPGASRFRLPCGQTHRWRVRSDSQKPAYRDLGAIRRMRQSTTEASLAKPNEGNFGWGHVAPVAGFAVADPADND